MSVGVKKIWNSLYSLRKETEIGYVNESDIVTDEDGSSAWIMRGSGINNKGNVLYV